jgi:NAD(P)-dependent dehydrogenase (short-subunit alcohol dehydrogenase family)
MTTDATSTQESRTAIVTGGASGIGLACAERLLAAGWRVGLLDRDAAALERLAARFGDDPAVRLSPLDVTDEPATETVLGAMAEAFGGIHGVVNSAGIGAVRDVLDTPVALFRTMLEVNVTGTFIVARAAARLMKESGGGSIVNIASISGLRGSQGRSAYGASKGAVITLTQVMAVDLARHRIRVNAIAPGPVRTPMVDAMHTPQTRRAYLHHIPLRRYAEPAEIAGAAQFLLDAEASGFVTGQVIAVDGGFAGAGMMEIEE